MSRSKAPSKKQWALIGVVGLAILMAALLAAWHWTPLHEYAEPRAIARWLRGQGDNPWMLPLVALVYVAASLVMFPNTVLCLGVIMALGPVAGTAYAYGGSLAAALVGLALGRRGGVLVEKLRSRGFDKLNAGLRRGGFMQVLMLRLLPIAPFSATNILCGAARVKVVHFVGATVIGISHYILGFAAFGHQAQRLLSDPSPRDVVVTVAIIAAMVGFAIWQSRSLTAARASAG